MDPTKEPSGDLSEPFAGHIRSGRRLIQDWPGDRTYGPDKKRFGQGQCVNCGFLSKRSIEATHPGVWEATVDDRLSGRYFFTPEGIASVPWCLVHAADLPGETQAAVDVLVETTKTATNPIPAQDIFTNREGGPTIPPGVITHREMSAQLAVGKVRDCTEWFPYREFQSPEEHRRERDMLRIEEERKAHQTRLAEMERKVQEDSKAIADDSRRIAEALRDAAMETGKFTTKWTYIAAFVAVVALVVVVATYLFPDLGHVIGHAIAPNWQPTP